MKSSLTLAWRLLTIAALLMGLTGPLGVPFAQAAESPAAPRGLAATPVVDGTIDTAYGPPVAQDPSGDGNGNANLDLLDLYVTSDADYVYFAFTVNADLSAANWGKYVIYLDTDGVSGSGATSDAWGRNVAADAAHRPEVAIYTWVDSPPYDVGHTQVVSWTAATTSWDWGSVAQLDEAALGAGTTSVLEWKVSKAKLGNPSGFWLEVWDTGGGGGDNAQDTINFPADDWNAADWSAQAALSVSTPYIAIDGSREATWEAPLASDPLSDIDEPNLDLANLYLAEDAGSYYLGFDAFASTWGMTYGVYLDTDQVSGSGAASDPWGRAVAAVSDHLPEYALYVWHEDTDVLQDAQLTAWNGSGWDYPTLVSLGGEQAYDPANDWIEYRIPKSALGNPSALALEAFTTGGSGHAQDSVPSDPNVAYTTPDWGSDTTTLSAFAVYPVPSLSLNLTAPDENAKFATAAIDVTGTVSPASGVTVTVDLNGTAFYTPTIAASGVFTQPVTLAVGSNTITVTATDGVSSAQAVRHVTYGASHDNDIWWDALAHDSRDPLYRVPGGPVTTGIAVTLRFRSAQNDLTGVQVRVWDDRPDTETLYDMSLASSDGTYDWWELTLPASDLPTVYWYRFIARDGDAVAYYEDDDARTGGLGEPFAESPDNSWQLTVYDPAFRTPDWVKNAVFYQIFVDRFRDGDPTNDPAAGSFFYDDPRGTITRSNTTEWNTPVCDPRDAGDPDCAGTWSQNFYGGDLQGVRDKLDYLQSLGVTALYLNPIFESPSNHKYDTTNYNLIDNAFGDLATFQALVSEADARGIKVVLDGVFNHVSSDSIYFDRYGRYPEVGACESPSSPYRDWFYFTDVTPGTGECAGSDGTPNAATYTSWFGYDSLPKLNASNPDVRALIWSDGLNSVAPSWIDQGASGWRLDVGGDVDPGLLNDPSNDYWEGFRSAVRAVYTDTYIVGEEWGNASSWLLGAEWDATMNYQYGSAMLSFWRDSTFTDNDHNSGSSAGSLSPLTPSELNERLLNWQERYPPEAFYAMMNLLDSHDTNRALFMLDHNAAVGTDDTPLQDPNYDWSDAIARLKGVTLLQFTLPGAPTIYYGDEVGLVGPVAYDGSTWQDDPYNRQPYPWLDESGTPFYAHLQTEQGQAQLREHYALLAATHNAHPALRTGDFHPLLVDDTAMLYAYGRKTSDDAAIVVVSRNVTTQTVSLDVSGYLPVGAQFVDVLHGNALYTVDALGQISLDVPPNFGVLLTLQSGLLTPPGAVTDLQVASESDGQVALQWSVASNADRYLVLRSTFSGGGYIQVGNVVTTVFTDTGLTNGQTYYYVVVSQNDTSGLQSGYSNEVSAVPHFQIGWANLDRPVAITHTVGLTPTENIYGQVRIDGQTSQPGPTPGLMAQVGYGLTGTLPLSWTHWVDASFNADAGNNDEFKASLLPEATGTYQYVYRYSTTGGRDWTYADQGGTFDPASVPPKPGVLTVLPAADTTPPSVPQNLRVTDWGTDFIALAWDASTDDTGVYAYDLYRSEGGAAVKVARVLSPTTGYTDTAVAGGVTYTYTVRALDAYFNFSADSVPVSQTAEAKMVQVTFRVRVPDYTPGTVYLAGNLPDTPQWDPGAMPMTQVSDDPDIWEYTLSLPDGTQAMYKYTRGSWDTVEQWRSISGLANRSLSVDYGTDGTQLVDDTATDWGNGPDEHKAVQYWRDPLVVSVAPADGAVGVDAASTITVTWSVTMSVGTQFDVDDRWGNVVTGTFALTDSGHTVVFTPSMPFTVGETYAVSISGQTSDGGDAQQVPVLSAFQVGWRMIFPLILR